MNKLTRIAVSGLCRRRVSGGGRQQAGCSAAAGGRGPVFHRLCIRSEARLQPVNRPQAAPCRPADQGAGGRGSRGIQRTQFPLQVPLAACTGARTLPAC